MNVILANIALFSGLEVGDAVDALKNNTECNGLKEVELGWKTGMKHTQ